MDSILFRHSKNYIGTGSEAPKIRKNEEENRIAVNNSSFKFMLFFPGKQKLRFNCLCCFRSYFKWGNWK